LRIASSDREVYVAARLQDLLSPDPQSEANVKHVKCKPEPFRRSDIKLMDIPGHRGESATGWGRAFAQVGRPVTTLLISHPACLAHDMGEGHPERPERIRAVDRMLESEIFQLLARDVAPRAEIAAIARVHPVDYIEAIRAATPTQGHVAIDQDTSMSPGTFEAALRSAGGAMFAVDEVMTRKVRNAFVATRPPGHHAETATPMGFCFFNNAAIAARHARAVYGAERVAIMDFDVHHGNGTQHIFWNDPHVMYTSTHEMPNYPGTGSIGERGEFDQIVNAPLRAGDGGDTFREAMEVAILPRIHDFAPDLIIISAGFDGHRRDPLGNLNLVEADYVWATRKLMELAQKHCGGRVVSVLEGGYDLEGLARSVGAHVTTLMEG
jgi:acetoin utilization deacetylase AcuC-like enzyme